MKILQHIPGFVDGSEPVKTYVFTAEDMEHVDFIKMWKRDPGFTHFSIHRNYWANPSDKCEQMHLLLAEYDQPKRAWWVVAYLSGEDALKILTNYPEWKGHE